MTRPSPSRSKSGKAGKKDIKRDLLKREKSISKTTGGGDRYEKVLKKGCVGSGN